jgi:outer membrane protein assembly factor BamB
MNSRLGLLLVLSLAFSSSIFGAEPAAEIRHSYLVLGAKTAIIDEDGKAIWEHAGGSRDGFVLPNGNVLLAYSDRVEEVTRDRQVVLTYQKSADNSEIGTAQRLYNGNTLVTELGKKPRLLEIDAKGNIVHEFALEPETDNAHMQTRMARQLKNGNYLVPHLLAFAVKEYTPSGKVVARTATDLKEIGGREAENWPFTAIRLDNGNTLVSLTHGNKVVEFDQQGKIVWKVDNEDVGGKFKDPCGSQRLANGNTVVGSHAATTGISMVEVTPDKKIVWTSDHPLAAGVHHFQILTTNGKPEPGMPLK